MVPDGARGVDDILDSPSPWLQDYNHPGRGAKGTGQVRMLSQQCCFLWTGGRWKIQRKIPWKMGKLLWLWKVFKDFEVRLCHSGCVACDHRIEVLTPQAEMPNPWA